MVTRRTSHTLGTIYVSIVWLGAPQLCYLGKSSTLLRSQCQLKDKLEFLGRIPSNNPLSSRSDSSLFICNYSGVSGLEYLSSSSKDLQFRGTHRDLSRSSSARLVLRGTG